MSIDELVATLAGDGWLSHPMQSASEADTAWRELLRLARLGASVEAMPKGHYLYRYVRSNDWELIDDYWDGGKIASGKTPQEALDRAKEQS
jgi:hypothetical protein